MTDDTPTLEDYETVADVAFDLDGQEIDRELINEKLEELYFS